MDSADIREFQMIDLPEDILSVILDNIPLSAYYVLRCTNKALGAFARTQFKSRLKQKWFLYETSRCIKDAFRDGQLELVKWLVDYRGMTIPDNLAANARNNSVCMLEWLKSIGHEFTVYDIPIYHVGYDEFSFILENATRGRVVPQHEISHIYTVAQMSRRFDVIKLALKYKSTSDIPWKTVIWYFADECDELIKIVNYTIEQQEATPDMIISAARKGFFKVVMMLRDAIDIPRETLHEIAGSAVVHNNMEMLQWVEDIHGFPNNIAYNANTIPMIEYLATRGYPPTAETFAFNVGRKNTEIISYLISAECPMNVNASIYALQNNDFATLKLLHSMGIPYEFTVEYGHTNHDIIKWMVENKPAVADITKIIIMDDPELVEWACSAGYLVFDEKCAKKAVEFGCVRIVDRFKCSIHIQTLIRAIPDIHMINLYLSKNIPPEDGPYVDNFIDSCVSSEELYIIATVLQNGESLARYVKFVPEHLRHRYHGPWSAVVVDSVITNAIDNSTTEVIEWLFEKTGCTVTRIDVLRAIDDCDAENKAKWLIKRYIREGNTLDADLLVQANKFHKVSFIHWMHQMGAPLSAELFKKWVTIGGPLVKWLYDAGCPMPVGMEVVEGTLYWYSEGEIRSQVMS